MRIFLVDNDTQILNSLEKNILDNTKYDVQTFSDTDSLVKILSETPDVIVIGSSIPGFNESELIEYIRAYSADIEVIVLGDPEEEAKTIKLLDLDVFDVLIKDEYLQQRLQKSLLNIEASRGPGSETGQPNSHMTEKYELANAIVGESKAIKNVLSLVEKAIAVQNMTVSIHGEGGTGKELVARTIHYNSVRRDHPFVTVNMGAVPKELIDSELFGHEKGAFPRAYTRSKGKLEQAHLGTLFINEIAELDINLQFKLFQAIQEKEITRVGSTKPVSIDTRIITATSKDLPEELRKGNFRDDLYYRLLGLPIVIPPLSEREQDVILLADYFLADFCQENKFSEKEFSPSARTKLLSHNYPGNVRELNAIVELAAVLSNSRIIEDEHILFSPTHAGLDIFNMDIPLREFEIRIIRHFLEKYNNNVVLVAKKLEIGKSKIYNMIKNGEI